MKNLLVLLAVVFGFSELSQARQITDPKELKMYEEAAKIGVQGYKCGLNSNLNYYIDRVNAVTISEDQQTMSLDFNRGQSVLWRVIITMDQAHKIVTAAKLEIYNMGMINDGTLTEPVIREGYVLAETLGCSK